MQKTSKNLLLFPIMNSIFIPFTVEGIIHLKLTFPIVPQLLGGQYRLEHYVSIFNSCGIESIKCKQQRDPCVRACDRTVELSRRENERREKRWRQLNCNTGVDGRWELMSVKCLSVFHLSFATRTVRRHVIIKGIHLFCTHIWSRSFIGTRTGERDELMATFVDHETTHCGEKGRTLNVGLGIDTTHSVPTQNIVLFCNLGN